MTRARRKVAMVLSGGGARGAYEVGVLSYVLDTFARRRGGAPPRLDMLCGTSVGAINSCFLAAHLGDPTLGVRRLVNLWQELRLEHVLGFGMRQAVALPRVLAGGTEGSGIFDVTPMARLIEREVPWRSIARTLRSGALSVLAVSATEVSAGRTVLFMQTAPSAALPSVAPPRTVIRPAVIGPVHALASAAIPLLFPPVRIGRELFMDGGVRQNTPISPALRLGATHVFVVGLSREVRTLDAPAVAPTAPSAAFVVGKILNALLLDHVQTDIEVLERVNGLLEDATKAMGEGFVDQLNRARAPTAMPYRRVASLVVRPSEDLGRLASDYVRAGKVKGGTVLTRRLFSILDVGYSTEADLASYLLFDGGFAKTLVDLGRADAEARRHEILEFFGSAAEDHEPDASDDEGADGSMPPPRIVG
jgi:NTE family protein